MKTVKDLKEAIKDMPDQTLVYVKADHGQAITKVGEIKLMPVEDTTYYAEIAWDENGEDLDQSKTKICLISD